MLSRGKLKCFLMLPVPHTLHFQVQCSLQLNTQETFNVQVSSLSVVKTLEGLVCTISHTHRRLGSVGLMDRAATNNY